MKYSNVYKIKAERCEMMEYIKKIALYMSVLLLIRKKKQIQIKQIQKKKKSKRVLRKR